MYSDPSKSIKRTNSTSQPSWTSLTASQTESLHAFSNSKTLLQPSSTSTPSSSLFSDLPKSAKYFLLASFLASYNPNQSDSQIFGSTRTRKGKGGKGIKQRASSRRIITNLQKGPKSCPLDRILAIYIYICDDTMQSPSMYSQVTNTINLLLISLVCPFNNLFTLFPFIVCCDLLSF